MEKRLTKIFYCLTIIIYILYMYAIFTINDNIGDVLSPILTLIACGYVFYAYVLQEKDKLFRIYGFFYTICLFSWFLCDLAWGMSTLILHVNPEDNLVITYGYSVTNIFLFLSFLVCVYRETKNWFKIQTLLDMIIIAVCTVVMLWVFVIQDDMEKAVMIKYDVINLVSIIINIIIFAWISVCFFSTRTQKIHLYIKFSMAGALVFVLVDLLYYYQYYFLSYDPNTLIDGAYMLSFTIMAGSAYVKMKNIHERKSQTEKKKKFYHFSKEAFIIIEPFIIILFKRNQFSYFLFLLIAILIYYVLTNYTQKNILQEELLGIERKHVTELEEKVAERTEEIVRILNTDIITGLYSRRYFEEYLLHAFQNQEEHISLLYIDLNKYRSIKALYGKYISESILKETGNRIREVVAETGKEGLVASYGENIFVVALKNAKVYNQDMAISQKIINRCSDKYYIESKEIVITMNIGIACYPDDSKNVEDMIKNADSAMMDARKQGNNRIIHYNENIGNRTYNRNKIEMKLKKVKFDEEFELYFQPQVSCATGDIIGTEALIRWRLHNGTMIPVLEFIPIMEESGQIIPAGYWIMEQAAKQLAIWKKHTAKKLRMAINVSVKQLREIDFTMHLREILNKYNISSDEFEIEITENIQIETNSEILSNMNVLKEMGIFIAIDDFGTGYSSLYYLKNLPMDRIKIAKELVDNIENDFYSHTIIQMVITIAKEKGIKVIAEGVETKEQWDCLKNMDCDEIQGYYFSKPIPADTLFKTWISETK